MIVLSKYTDPTNVPNGIPNDFNFGLEQNKEYLVLSTLFTDNQCWYLVDENGKPNFFPYQIFEIKDNKLNIGYFNLISWEDEVYPLNKKFIWGYQEICFDKKHYENLIDRKSDALEIYFNRKEEMRKAYEDGYLCWS